MFFKAKSILATIVGSIFIFLLAFALSTAEFVQAESSASPTSCNDFKLLQPALFPLPGSASSARALRIADVNNDGIPDILVVLPDDNKLSVQLGDGEGGIQSTASFAAGTNPADLELGDFDRDGEIDVAITNQAVNQISILVGDGAGNFALQTSFASTSSPTLLEIGHFDNDGYLDIAVANSFSMKIFRGNRDLTFTLANTISVPFAGPQILKSGDFNNDGVLDLAASYQEGNGRGVSVYLGQGNGNFALSVTLPDIYVYALALADFDNNGTLDLVANDYQLSQTLAFRGNGNGTFQPPVITSSQSFFSVETFDYNRDGKLDLVTSASILLGDGNGNFTFFTSTSPNIGTVTSSIGIADFNSDNLADFAMISGIGSNTSIVLNNDGERILTSASAFTRQRAFDIDSADFNLDGRNDLVSIDAYNNTAWVFLQDENGYMVSTSANGLPVGGGFNVSGYSVRVADLNNDGKPDFVAPDSFARKVVTFTGFGDGTFERRIIDLPTNPGTPTLVRTGDFNGDGKTDLIAMSNASRNFSILLNDGNNGFNVLPPQSVGSTAGPNKVAIGDFTGDGKTDLVVARFFDPTAVLFAGNSDGTFVTSSPISASPNILEIRPMSAGQDALVKNRFCSY
ncbi:MAG: VCBS repeat-containing protein [Pyrinomonadaceae bacterium]